jgi:Xaa-Pro dipeptidase
VVPEPGIRPTHAIPEIRRRKLPPMSALTRQKVEQASRLVAESDLDVWLTFVRETFNGGETVLPLLTDVGLVWLTAFLFSKSGERIVVVGNYDAEPFETSGDWTSVVPYIQGIREPLIAEFERLIPRSKSARIGVNFSLDNDKADGITHGMFLLLESYLMGTRFEGCLVSAESVVGGLRSQKTPDEVRRMRVAIAETDNLFNLIGDFARIGKTEAEVQRRVHQEIDSKGYGYAWQKAGNPIVNSGPDSMVGHGVPSDRIKIEAGHIFHIDLGIVVEEYSSDIQSCWYVAAAGEETVPDDVQKAFNAVIGAIDAGAKALKPGAAGWEVDAAARAFLVGQGFEEYMHALGHQVGRVAHDGGVTLGPRWERYGKSPFKKVQANEVYTLELGVLIPTRGYLGIEEMVLVTNDGLEWLTTRQLDLPVLGRQPVTV